MGENESRQARAGRRQAETRARITQIDQRLDRITGLLAKLRSGSPLTEGDLKAAREAAVMSAHAAARAHANDKRSHRDAARAHERAVAQFEMMGDHARAAAHRAAAARDAAAAGHDDVAGHNDAG